MTGEHMDPVALLRFIADSFYTPENRELLLPPDLRGKVRLEDLLDADLQDACFVTHWLEYYRGPKYAAIFDGRVKETREWLAHNHIPTRKEIDTDIEALREAYKEGMSLEEVRDEAKRLGREPFDDDSLLDEFSEYLNNLATIIENDPRYRKWILGQGGHTKEDWRAGLSQSQQTFGEEVIARLKQGKKRVVGELLITLTKHEPGGQWKRALHHMHIRGVLTNKIDALGRGYGLAEWETSGPDQSGTSPD
jgi:hypothetical protein